MRATVAKINLGKLRHNVAQLCARAGKNVQLCVAVKADAYGHGAVPCAQAALEAGARWLAVATVDEGAELRAAGISAPVLVLSLCTPQELPVLVAEGLTPLVFDGDFISLVATEVRRQGKRRFPVHLAVDSGMGRIGCYPEEAAALARRIATAEDGALALGGMCTHFAAADSPAATDEEYTDSQLARFRAAVCAVSAAGISPGLCHCANSAAALDRSDDRCGMVRSGITVYGCYPGDKRRDYFAARGVCVDLRPVMTLATQVVSVRRLRAGMSVSYGHTWTAQADTVIGVLPLGYADGLLRCYGPHLRVVVTDACGTRRICPVRGRICMDQCMIDFGAVSDDEMRRLRWSEAVVFGDTDTDAATSAQSLADAVGTISYEVTSAVSRRVPRLYID